MCNPPNWSLGDAYLRANVPELAPLVDKFSPCPLQPQNPNTYFTILLTGIVSQQLPPEVSQELMQKLEAFLGKPITPQAVLAANEEDFVTAGLMAQKIDYVRSFAKAIVQGQVTIDKFAEMTDSQISKQLLAVRGLGQWTIEMFLLLGLCRTDVVPTADFIFKKELQALLNLPAEPKRGQINKLTEPWRPWRSLAVWYMWQNANSKTKK